MPVNTKTRQRQQQQRWNGRGGTASKMSLRQIVYELHMLLERAGERSPDVLVGHSYGGWLVRLYEMTYPSEIIGLVLVEPGVDDPWRMMADGKLVRSSDLVTGWPIPAVKIAGPLLISDIPLPALQQMRAGLAEASRQANEPPRDKLPLDAQRMRTWALGQLGHVAAAVNPVEHEELAALRAEQAKGKYPLGDLPLVVITRGMPEENGPNAQALEDEHRRNHAGLPLSRAAGSKSSRLRVVITSSLMNRNSSSKAFNRCYQRRENDHLQV